MTTPAIADSRPAWSRVRPQSCSLTGDPPGAINNIAWHNAAPSAHQEVLPIPVQPALAARHQPPWTQHLCSAVSVREDSVRFRRAAGEVPVPKNGDSRSGTSASSAVAWTRIAETRLAPQSV